MSAASATTATIERHYLKLLKVAPFERRPAGWRFGARKIADCVVERLVAQGRALRDENRVWIVPAAGSAT